MQIRVHYAHSVKDGSGSLFTFRGEVEVDVPVDGMEPKEKVANLRKNLRFLHNEIHLAVEEAQVHDGLLNAADAKHLKPSG